MIEKTIEGDRFNWRLQLYALLGAFIIFIPVALCEPDISAFLYLVVVLPITSIFLLIGAIRKKRRQRLSVICGGYLLGYFGGLGRKLFCSPRRGKMVSMVARLQGQGSGAAGLGKRRVETCRLGWLGDVRTGHLGVSCFRSDRFAFDGSHEPSTRQVQRHTLRGLFGTSFGKPLVLRPVLHRRILGPA
jgi:hypothetical protein